MTKNNIFYRNISALIIIFVLLVFFATLFYLPSEDSILSKLLTAMSVSGFAGMFGSFFLTLFDQYLQRKNYHVCVLGKKYEFTSSLMQGIQDYFAEKPNAKVEFFAFDNIDTDSKIETFIKNQAKTYDGMILIPEGTVTEGMFQGIRDLLESKKHVVLLDQNLSPEQQQNLKTRQKPVFVSSDFDLGGCLIAEYINSYIRVNGADNTRVILLTGPNKFDSLKIRGKSLLYGLSAENNQRLAEVIELNTMCLEDLADNLKVICNKLEEWEKDPFMDLKNKQVLIYCGNDTLAKHLMRQMDDRSSTNMIKNFLGQAAEIVFIGYDGIQGIDDQYELDRYGYKYVTVDVLLKKQGRLSAEIIYNMFEYNNKINFRNTELVEPKLILWDRHAYSQAIELSPAIAGDSKSDGANFFPPYIVSEDYGG